MLCPIVTVRNGTLSYVLWDTQYEIIVNEKDEEKELSSKNNKLFTFELC